MMPGYSPPNNIDVDDFINAVTFSANGDHLLSGRDGVQVWGVDDGQQTARLEAPHVRRLAVSNDNKWIAAGTISGWVFMWNAATYEQVLKHWEDNWDIFGVDFSPDSTRLVSASDNRTATIWDVATRTQVQTLRHEGWLRAAKYSPQGDRIATATHDSVRIWGSTDGRLLVHIKVTVTALYNSSLLWCDNDLFVLSGGKLKRFESSTGSTVSEWSVPDSDEDSCIALPRHGEFIAYSTNDTVTLWDTSTHVQLALIQLPQRIYSIALSPDDQLLAIGGLDRKIIIKDVQDSLPPRYSVAPFIDINDTTLELWRRDQLVDTETLLTRTISDSAYQNYHALAARSLVRSQLHLWDLAVDDAESSIKTQPSVIGYIAKSIAFIGRGQNEDGCRVFDMAFRYCDPIHVDHLLLIKAIAVFMAGKRIDALSRVNDLIATVDWHPIYYLVQACMYFQLGEVHMENNDSESAVLSFEHVRTRTRHHAKRLFTISLIFGWKFDDLDINVRQRLCEALYTAGRVQEAAETLLELIGAFGKELHMGGSMAEWISGFTQLCLLVPATNNATIKKITCPPPLLKEWAKYTLVGCSWKEALLIATSFAVPRFTVYQAVCEHLESVGLTTDAIGCFHQMNSELAEETTMHDEKVEWVVDFKQRCVGQLTQFGDEAANARRHDDAIAHYSVALSLDAPVPQEIFLKRTKVYIARGSWEDALHDANELTIIDPSSEWVYETVLREWAKVTSTRGSWRNALATTSDFEAPRLTIYRALCEHLESIDRVMDAAECLLELTKELTEKMHDKEAEWLREFTSRCRGKLEDAGDSLMDNQQYDEAIARYSAALSLDPAVPRLFIKRSNACIANGLCEAALDDANKAIGLDPLSPWGYETKHVALHRTGDYENAIIAFETMFLKISQSSDPKIRAHHRRYVNPGDTKLAIWDAVQNAIRDLPRVLINTISGRLLDKSEQAALFESAPEFNKLISSMTTHIDQALIEHDVMQYYRYAMFSHKWEDNEPLFEEIIHVLVYDLEESHTHHKLQMFCKIVRDDGLYWAWSDTCCINKADHFILQEALVSMFKWYHGAAETLVLLHGVPSPSRRGDLVKSIWNSRAWTFQEYHASKVVRFYNEDWTLYMNLDIPNHKESPEILAEMEEATGISTRALRALQPGLDDIRKKLNLASTRKTTFIEDTAYSLLGIFSMSLPVVYGEGDQALGRLLAQLLTSSGDTSILAWTGKSGSFNSCLPGSISVFKEPSITHIPLATTRAMIESTAIGLRTTLPNLSAVTTLYDRLVELRVPSFAGKRMTLPCIVFKLGPLSVPRSGSEQVFRAQTAALGIVEIRIEEDLSQFKSLYLVHPWIDYLLDRQPAGSAFETIPEQSTEALIGDSAGPPSFPNPSASSTTLTVPSTRTTSLASRFGLPFGWTAARRRDGTLPRPSSYRPLRKIHSYEESLRPPSSLAQSDKEMLALRAVSRLRQPFGALLLTPDLSNVAAYRRVAAESSITVQVGEITPTILDKLINSIRVLDVL